MAKKKSSGSSVPGRRTRRSVASIPDARIDYSDIPPLSDRQLGVMKPLGRPLIGSSPRKMVSVRLDPDVLEKLKQEAKRVGKPYQSLINEVLSRFVRKPLKRSSKKAA